MESNPYAPPVAALDAPAGPPGTPARVGFWPRVGAALLDFLVVALGGALTASFASSLFPEYVAHILEPIQTGKAATDPNLAATIQSVTAIVALVARWGVGASLFGVVYNLLEGFLGRAVGKLLLGLRIADVNGRPASVERLLGRMALKQSGALVAFVAMVTQVYALESVSRLLGFVTFVGLFFVLARQKQTLHDLAARTAVYQNKDVIAAAR